MLQMPSRQERCGQMVEKKVDMELGDSLTKMNSFDWQIWKEL